MRGNIGLVFEGYKIYGPYGSHRKIVFMVSPTHRTTMSYARYLMSVHLGRTLTRDEEVDHVDDDCTNDAIENLQLLTPRANRQKEARRRGKAMVTLTCPECGIEFVRERRNTHLRSKVPSAPSCCSRRCAALSGHRRREST